MTEATDTIKFEFELDVEHELEVDQDGILTVSCYAYAPEDDDAKVVVVPFKTLVENAIEYSREEISTDSYGDLYKIGSRSAEASEEILKAAEQQEDYVTGQGQIPYSKGQRTMYDPRELSHLNIEEVLRNIVSLKFTQTLNNISARCKKDGTEFELKVDDLRPFPLKCPVLGIDIDYFKRSSGPANSSPSIDRIDPTKGYVCGNVW